MVNSYSSRKFVTMIGTIVLFTVLLVLGKISESIYSDLIFIVIGGYFAGNVGEHFAKRNQQ